MKTYQGALVAVAATVVAVHALTSAVLWLAVGDTVTTLVPGFADIHFVVNRGVSFGLFAQDSVLGKNILAAATALLIAILATWASRATRPLVGIGLGTIIGGALYNVADRVLYGGVFDFLALRIGSVPLFVCNAADIAISVGVIILLLDAARDNGTEKSKV